MKEGDVVIGRCSSSFAAVSKRHLTHFKPVGVFVADFARNKRDQFYGTLIYFNSIYMEDLSVLFIVLFKNSLKSSLLELWILKTYIKLYIMHFVITCSKSKDLYLNVVVVQINFKGRNI